MSLETNLLLNSQQGLADKASHRNLVMLHHDVSFVKDNFLKFYQLADSQKLPVYQNEKHETIETILF